MLGFSDACDFVKHHVRYDSGRASINVTSVLLPCLNGKDHHAKGKKNEQEKKFVSPLSVLIMIRSASKNQKNNIHFILTDQCMNQKMEIQMRPCVRKENKIKICLAR